MGSSVFLQESKYALLEFGKCFASQNPAEQ